MNLEYLLTTFNGTIHFVPLQSRNLRADKPAMSMSITIKTKLTISLRYNYQQRPSQLF